MDEGTRGTIHFGFGSNSTVGGVNAVPFHFDMVFRSPSMRVGNVLIVEDGKILL